MIIPDKKKAVGLILSKMAPDGSEKQMDVKSEEAIGQGDEALHAICEDILMAVKDGSALQLAEALKAFSASYDGQDESQGE